MLHQWLPFRKIFRESMYLSRWSNTNDHTQWYLRRFGNDHIFKNTRPCAAAWQEALRNQNFRDRRSGLAKSFENIPSFSESHSVQLAYSNTERPFRTLSEHVPAPDENYKFLVQSLGETPFFKPPYVPNRRSARSVACQTSGPPCERLYTVAQ